MDCLPCFQMYKQSMHKLLLVFEDRRNCERVANVLREAQATNKQISGVRAANLLSTLTHGCVIYGPMTEIIGKDANRKSVE